MKKRAKAAHWLSDIFGNPDSLERKAALADRKMDNSVGAKIRGSRNHRPAPECDWRRLSMIQKDISDVS